MKPKRPSLPHLLLAAALLATAVLAACAAPPRPAAPPAPPDGWQRDVIFYGVYVRAFHDSGFDGYGDLNGLLARLDYLNDGDPATTDDLGVNALWLLPVTQADGLDDYAVRDFQAIHADYGDQADFRRLVAAARARGMRIIVDLALNQTAANHPWFIAAQDPADPRRDWYVWIDHNPAEFGPNNQPVWHQVGDAHYYGIFGADKPDLNYENPAVTAAMTAVARFWLEEMGVDGLRLDAIHYLIADETQQNNTQATLDWLAAFNTALKAAHPDALLVGDAVGDAETVARYVAQGAVDLGLAYTLADGLLFSVDNNDPTALRGRLSESLYRQPDGRFATFLTTPRQDRAMRRVQQLEQNPAKARLAATALLTLPGVPFLLYGEELGLGGRARDGSALGPMPWDGGLHGGFSVNAPWRPFSDDPQSLNVTMQSADPDALLSHYRRLIRLRRAHGALRRGGLATFDSNCGGALAYLRHMPAAAVAPADSVITLLNFARAPQSDCRFSLERSDLTPGVYALRDGLTGAEAGEITVGENGRIADFAPFTAPLPAHGSLILVVESGE
jgi:alpha-amylase